MWLVPTILFRFASIAVLPSLKERLVAWILGDSPVVRQAVGDWIDVMLETRMWGRVVLGGRDDLVGDAASTAQRATAYIYIRGAAVELVPDAGRGRLAPRRLGFFESAPAARSRARSRPRVGVGSEFTHEAEMDKGRIVSSVLVATLALGGIAAAGVFVTYQRDMQQIRARLAAGSQVIQTARGPVEYAVRGEG